MGGSGTNGFIFKSVKNMKRVDIKARAFFFKSQGPKMLTQAITNIGGNMIYCSLVYTHSVILVI